MKPLLYKIIALAAAFSMLFALTSCININKPDGLTTESGETDTEPTSETDGNETQSDEPDYNIVENQFINQINAYLNLAGSADFGGASFLIASPSTSLIDGEDKGLFLSELYEARNRDVEDKYNVVISTKKVDLNSMYDQLSAAKYTGEFYADSVMIPQYAVQRFAVSGLLLNMNSLPFLDLDSGFNIESAVNAGSGRSTVWAVAGWSTLDEDILTGVFFNKDLVKETGLEDPYKLAHDDRWTWDAFFEYTSAVSGLDGTDGEKIYSYGSQNAYISLADSVYFSEGNTFVSSGLGTTPVISVDAESSSHTFETFRKLYDDENKIQNSLDAIKIFADGGAMFLIDQLGTMKTIKNSKAVWGILPMPKKDVSQENYISLMPSDSMMIAVPNSNSGTEKAGRVISALNICSVGYLIDYYLTNAMYYYLRDNSSIENVEKICYSAVWDMAYTIGGYDSFIPNSTYFAVRDVFENGHDIQNYLDYYSSGANATLSRFFS
ncbi:MAG: extracellular solute-binding protein [Clostridia bacterium]|nr:extracellular solute-binding protein [Clostridia bacterium]